MESKFKPNGHRLLGLSNYIKTMRAENKMGTKELAVALGVSASYVTKLEGQKIVKPDPLMLRKMADIFQVSPIRMYLILGYLETGDFNVKLKEAKWEG